MQKKSTTLFVICGLVAAMFFFSLGILTSRDAHAQPIYSKLSNFPRQSELWNIAANYDTTWDLNAGHIFTVSRDALNRLPVLTQSHQPCSLYVQDGAVWQEVESLQTRTTFIPGIILKPGRYALGLSVTQWSHRVVLSGYWALP